MNDPIVRLILALVLGYVAIKMLFRFGGTLLGAAASGFRSTFSARPRHHIVVGTPGGPVAMALPRDPAERFAAVAEAYGRDEDDLVRIECAIWRTFAAYFIAGPILAVVVAWQWHDMLPITRLAYSMFTVPWILLMAKTAHEHWTVRRRSFDSFAVFLTRPREWWPPSRCTEIVAPRLPLSLSDRVDIVRIHVRAAVLTAAWRLGLRSVPPAPPSAKRIAHMPEKTVVDF